MFFHQKNKLLIVRFFSPSPKKAPKKPKKVEKKETTTTAVKSKKKVKKIDSAYITSTVEPIYISPKENEQNLPRLQHGLERVLFNPGVHFLTDPRTNVHNFDPYLRYITQPKDFDFNALPPFKPPSKDETLHQIARDFKIKYTGSTSSTSQALSQIYFFITNFRDTNLEHFPQSFQKLSSFTRMTRAPCSIILRPQLENIYSIDAEKYEEVRESIMMLQGKSLENFFTLSKEEYAKLLLNSKNEKIDFKPECFSYCRIGNLLLRSQLDCHHPYLPRKVFDIKTRATVAIRMNSLDYKKYLPYRLNQLFGYWNSFSREYYDMIRSAFLKYSFQVRIGNMDGLFVSYHNTEEIFGFQYVSREELDSVLFGTTQFADQSFSLCLQILNYIMDKVLSEWPGETIRVTLAAGKEELKVYAEQMTHNQKPIESLAIENLRKYSLRLNRFLNNNLISELPKTIHENDSFDLELFIAGALHPNLQVYQEFRQKLVELNTKRGTTEALGKMFEKYFTKANEKETNEPLILKP